MGSFTHSYSARINQKWDRYSKTEWLQSSFKVTMQSGTRKRGKQERRWRDDLTNYNGTTWTRQAQDQRRWQLLEEGYIQQWMQKPW